MRWQCTCDRKETDFVKELLYSVSPSATFNLFLHRPDNHQSTICHLHYRQLAIPSFHSLITDVPPFGLVVPDFQKSEKQKKIEAAFLFEGRLTKKRRRLRMKKRRRTTRRYIMES
ncbi:hypothetical protein L1987_80030 [Smallanthus sonchifolius]|uniref:Uncharacterized protein n=1 Tax=Smallanthus sonchifolius TaxID=185202 RepID=A0ACB8YMQ9_9ASTR|nr:hypothetical protein L1987_80030 [Smallanthus sonchifolius]